MNIKTIFRTRLARYALQIVLMLLMFFSLKVYMQRDLAQGVSPPVEAALLDGEKINLQSYREKPLLLYFWATWCPVCKLQNSTIDTLQQHYQVVTVAMNSGPPHQVRGYVRKNGLNYPVITDEHGLIAKRFGVSGVPASFVIDPRGNIAYREMGYTSSWGLRFRLWLAEN